MYRWKGALLRVAVAVVAVPFACVWADGILHVTERATDVVFSTDDLRAMVPAAPEPPCDPPQPDESQAAESSPPSGEALLPDKDTTGTQCAEPAEAVAKVEPAVEQTRETTQEERCAAAVNPSEQGGAAEGQPSAESAPAPNGPETGAPLTLATGAEGSLASFAGPAAGSAGDGESTGAAGAGLIWDVTFAEPPTLENVARVAQTRLAACRVRRGFTELVLLGDGELVRPLAVDEFIAAYPAFGARRGILLPQSVLTPVEERLLVHGGGWQAWLLVEDALLADWVAEIEESPRLQGAAWPQVQRIAVRLAVERRAEARRCRIIVTEVRTREHAAEDAPRTSAPSPG
jgi:hypothetical protein